MRSRRFTAAIAPISPEEQASLQPQHGDVVLHCGHMRGAAPREWWTYPEPQPFQRPDGTQGTAKWLVACMDCYARADGNPRAIVVRGDGVWQGDEPGIREVPAKGAAS